MIGSVRRVFVLGALAACTLGAAPDVSGSPAPPPVATPTASQATALYDAAYDRWRALPIPQFATYASLLTVDVRGRRERTRAYAVAYRRHDNTCLVVGVPLDVRDRPDAAQVTNRCLAPDYAFNFVPQYGGSGPLPLDIATPAPEEPGAQRTIGHIVVRSRPYAIAYVGTESIGGTETQHLALRPLGNPRERILRDLWIDPATKGIVRLRGETTFKGGLVRLGFQADYAETATTQALVRVTGGAKAQMLLVRVSGGFAYGLSDVVYPARLPAWIFEGRNARSAGAMLASDRDAVRADAAGGGGAAGGAQ